MPDEAPATIGGSLTAAQLEDLATMAADEKITLDEAIDRYGWHESFSILVSELRDEHPDAFAGARIEQDGNPWVAFASAAPDGAQSRLAEFNERVMRGTGREAELRADRGFTEADLDRRLAEVHATVLGRRDLVAQVSSGYDVESGTIAVDVEAAGMQADDRKQVADSLRNDHSILRGVDIEVVERVQAQDDAIYGGSAISTCTSGFSVTKSGTRGMSTAAHCGNSQSDGSVTLYFQNEHDGWWGDVQWHTSSSYEADDFYSGSFEANLRDVSGVGFATEGQSLCRNGKSTGKECDTVYQLNHCVGDRCHLTAMHNDEASGGDSGGPWFYGNTAYGIHSGYKWWNFKYRDVFTPVRYIDDGMPGVYVATS